MKQAVQQIHDKNEQYRQLLDEQYRNIFQIEKVITPGDARSSRRRAWPAPNP
jgi:hypothetical protein